MSDSYRSLIVLKNIVLNKTISLAAGQVLVNAIFSLTLIDPVTKD